MHGARAWTCHVAGHGVGVRMGLGCIFASEEESRAQGLREVGGAQTYFYTGTARCCHMCPRWGGEAGGGTPSCQRGPVLDTLALSLTN